MNHVDSFVMKLTITFPCLINRIIMNKHHNVLHPEDAQLQNARPLNLDKKLFVGTHVPNCGDKSSRLIILFIQIHQEVCTA